MKDALIKLISTQSDGEDNESTELITRGKYGREKDGFVIMYDETEATGYAGSTTKIIVVELRLEFFDGGKSFLVAQLADKAYKNFLAINILVEVVDKNFQTPPRNLESRVIADICNAVIKITANFDANDIRAVR